MAARACVHTCVLSERRVIFNANNFGKGLFANFIRKTNSEFLRNVNRQGNGTQILRALLELVAAMSC